VRANYLSNLSALAIVERFAGNPGNGDRLRGKAVELADRWVGSSPPDADLLAAAASTYGDLASAQRLREEFRSAAAGASRNLELARQAYALDPKNITRLRAVTSGYLTAGYVELDAGRYRAAIDQFSQGNRLLDGPLADHPKHPALRLMRTVLLHKTAEATWKLRRKQEGNQADALPLLQEAYRIGSDLAADDPANDAVESALSDLEGLYGSVLQMLGRPAQALPLLTHGNEYYSRHWKEVPSDTNAAFNLAIGRVWISDCRRDLHDLKGALDESRSAAEIWDRLLAMRPGTFRYLHQKADNLNTMGNLLALMGDVEAARDCFSVGLEIAEGLPKQDASYSTAVVVNELRESAKKLERAERR